MRQEAVKARRMVALFVQRLGEDEIVRVIRFLSCKGKVRMDTGQESILFIDSDRVFLLDHEERTAKRYVPSSDAGMTDLAKDILLNGWKGLERFLRYLLKEKGIPMPRPNRSRETYLGTPCTVHQWHDPQGRVYVNVWEPLRPSDGSDISKLVMVLSGDSEDTVLAIDLVAQQEVVVNSSVFEVPAGYRVL